MNEKIVNRIGWFASFMALSVFFSYIDQIRLNVAGQVGSIILPIVTMLNCITWTLYAWLKPKKDWPIIFCNFPGIILGFVTALTAVVYK
ncbi:MAG: SemiSWEET family transporter [Patescibacteria group bacterium]